MIVISFVIFTAYSTLRHVGLLTLYYDLGLYSNSIWRTVHGYDSWNSLIFPSTPGHISHISPILGLVAAAYYIFPDPVTLLVIQATVLTIAAYPLYLTSLKESGSEKLSLAVAGAYLLNPGLHGVVRYDFHIESFLPLFIFSAHYFWKRSRYVAFCLFFGMMLATIEFSAVIGVVMAFAIALEGKRLDRYVLTAAVLSTSLLGIILVSTIGNPVGLLGWPANWLTRQFQGSASGDPAGYMQWLSRILSNPLSLLESVGYDIDEKLAYLGYLLVPAGLGVVRYPVRMLPSLPWIALVLVSSRYTLYNLDFQYSIFIIPFVYLAAIPFLHRIYTLWRGLSLVGVAIVLMVLLSALSPVRPLVMQPFMQSSGWPQASPLLGTINAIQQSIPDDATILVQIDIFPQLSNKPFAIINYSMPPPPHFIVVNTNSPRYDWVGPDLGIPRSIHEQSDQLLKDYPYELLVSSGGLRFYRLVTLGQVPLAPAL